MRHTVSNAEVYHLYANQRKDDFEDHARNGQDSCSFQGRDAYSYRAKIATYTDLPKHNKKTEKQRSRAVLIDVEYAEDSSVTTHRHVKLLQDAFSGHNVPVFVVPCIDMNELVTDGPEKVAELDVVDHIRNMSYLRQIAVNNTGLGHKYNKYDDHCTKLISRWLSYTYVFKLRRLLNDVDKKIYDFWIENGRDSLINRTVAQDLQGPFKSSDLTVAETRVIHEMAKGKADSLTTVFLSYWGKGKEPEELGHQEPLNADVFNKAVYNQNQKWLEAAERKAKQEHRLVVNNTEYAEIKNTPIKERYRKWKETGERKWLEADRSREAGRMRNGRYDTSVTYGEKWPAHSIFDLPKRVFFPALGFGGQSQFRVSRVVGNTVVTSAGVSISGKEFSLYWKRFLRPLWNVRFNESMFQPLFKLMRYNKDHRVSRAYSIDNIDMRYGLFKIGCHIMIFDDLADNAHTLGLESNVLQWRPACISQRERNAEHVQ